MVESQTYRLAVDIGGTFTDVVLQDPQRSRTTIKVLTTPQAPEQGVMQGITQVLETAGKTAKDIQILIHGTTLATNALIERKGAKTAFLTTAGFRDILEMGFEKRYAHYDLNATLPKPLVPRPLRFTVAERKRATGETVIPLDVDAVRNIARQMQDADINAVAIGFLHAYAHPEHEQQAAAVLQQELPAITVCLSSEVCPEMREYERFSTTCANAYVRPLMAGYLNRLRNLLDEQNFTCALYLMMSGGGLTTLEQATRFPIRLVESGPAGGAILAASLAGERQLDKVLAFDMGGTTAKMCLIDQGRPQRNRRFEIARVYRDMKGSGLPVRIPVIEMVEIGAGGGSIARVDTLGRISVGPDSAGSEPGPVAYGRGGTAATVTDANLVLGKLDPEHFAGGRISLNLAAAGTVIEQTIGQALQLNEHWAAAGVIEIVEENMANAARVHAIERGKEASEYTMIAFGGGAPLHAARLAQKLGIKKIIVPAGAGVGSAIGFLQAPISYQVVRSLRTTLEQANPAMLNGLLDQMSSEALSVVQAGARDEAIHCQRTLELRYLGQGHELAIELPDRDLLKSDLVDLRQQFEQLYQRIYGLTMPEVAVETVSWSVTVSTATVAHKPLAEIGTQSGVSAKTRRKAYDPGTNTLLDMALYWRDDLVPGSSFSGPAIVAENETSTVIPSGFTAMIDAGGAIVLEQTGND